MAYTYLIGWKKHNKWYYGVRYAKSCNPQELWKTYFTSSKYVKEFNDKHGDPDIIEIRKIFNCSKKARTWESKVLRRIKIFESEKWLNKTTNKSIDPILALMGAKKNKGTPKSEIHKKNISKGLIGRKWSCEQRAKFVSWWNALSEQEKKEINDKKRLSATGKRIKELNPMFGKKGENHHNFGKKLWKFKQPPMLGVKMSVDSKEKMRNAKIGKKQSFEHIQKRLESRKNNKLGVV